ncbi:TetR/AcrR family transcriptional regulator [Alkalihalobacillus sp. CinArs1]|uniref:TetR/AcrR family transcriptional regulator n=1 Tax=Alkalihalobacillus sp. CinArs1 TaxID=2995314 RepID=UPI0022DD71FB|nr:TetR/AcrR family transcriptional regulator [Alkalihalobacillus sp. CinArs1]
MAQETQKVIKEKALILFAQKGFEGTSLNDIADEVGIKKPSLYAHFKNKEDLFLAVINKVTIDYNTFFEETAKEIASLDPEKQLYTLLIRNTAYLQNHELGLIFKRMFLFPPESLRSDIYDMFEATEGVMKEVVYSILEKMDSKLDCDQIFDAYLCLLDGVFEQLFYYSKEEHSKRLEHSWALFINGINYMRVGD